MAKLFILLIAALTTGCATTFDLTVRDAEEALTTSPRDHNYVRARYCLNRAKSDAGSAQAASTADVILVALGGTTAGVGTTLGGVSVALKEGASSKEGLGVAGTALIGASAGVLLLRTALNLSESAQTAKIAAAKRVEAATRIIDAGASNDDRQQFFGDCIAEDIKVASAAPGTKGGQPKERELAQARAEVDRQTLRLGQLNQAKVEAERKRDSIPAAATIEGQGTNEEARKKAQERVDQINADIARAEGELKKAQERETNARNALIAE